LSVHQIITLHFTEEYDNSNNKLGVYNIQVAAIVIVVVVVVVVTSCARGDTICPCPSSPVGAPAPCTPPSRHNIAVVSHAQYVLMVTAASASRVKAAASKAAW